MTSIHKSIILTAKARLFCNEIANSKLPHSLREGFINGINMLNLNIQDDNQLIKFKEVIESHIHILLLNRIYELRLKRITFKLEIHRYAPELNKLHTNIGEIKVPNQTDINKAIEYASRSPQIRQYL